MLKLLLCAAISMSTLVSSLAANSRSRTRSRSSRVISRVQHSAGLRGTSNAASATRSGTPEQLEEWVDSKKAVSSKFSDTQLFEMADSITAEAYGKELHSLVDKQTSRFVGEAGNTKTADYLKKNFKDMGLDVTEQTIEDHRITSNIQSGDIKAPHTNVIGFLKGGDLAHEVILLGAHYDSVNWEDTSAEAPGVDDNGSGSSLMLAVARALTGAGKKFQPRRSVMFVAFNAEEEGLVGSDHFAQMFSSNGPATDEKVSGIEKYGDLKAVLIADEVAWPGSGKEQRQAIFETKGKGQGIPEMIDTLARLASLKNSTSSIPGDGLGDGSHNFVVNYHGFGSDHMSFLKQGIPAVLLIERDDDYHANTWGHSARDTFDHVDMKYGASMTRLALRAVAALANPA